MTTVLPLANKPNVPLGRSRFFFLEYSSKEIGKNNETLRSQLRSEHEFSLRQQGIKSKLNIQAG